MKTDLWYSLHWQVKNWSLGKGSQTSHLLLLHCWCSVFQQSLVEKRQSSVHGLPQVSSPTAGQCRWSAQLGLGPVAQQCATCLARMCKALGWSPALQNKQTNTPSWGSLRQGQATPCRPGSLFLKHDEQLLPLRWRPSQPQNVFPTKLATRKANSFPHFYVVSFWTRRNQILISISVLVMKVSYHSGGKLEQKLAKGSPDWDRQLSTMVSYLYPSHLDFVGWAWWANWTWLLTSLSTIPCPFPEFPSHLHAPTNCIRG